MFDLAHLDPMSPVVPGRDAVPLPDARAIRKLGAGFCARHAVLPLRAGSGFQPIAVADPDRFTLVASRIRSVLGDIVPVPTKRADLMAALTRHGGLALAREAEERCPPDRSCRGLRIAPSVAAGIGVLLVAAVCLAPSRALIAGQVVAIGILAIQTALYLVAMWPRRTGRMVRQAPSALPTISILLPLYREEDIAPMLLERIEAVDYPRDRFEVWLIMECDDHVTARAISRVALPAWAHVLTVAPGEVQTKPRAMNVALDFCRGTIVGVYDAEDAPESDQLLRVAARFAAAKPNVAALQGRLSFYNTRASWLTRCFSIDYAAWFWMILPAIGRLGWPIPLGGTTIFLRRDALEAVGGWDAHNVTEDADLGLRLARAGWRTELIDSVTREEATARPLAWIKQRSRWQKGYAITWAAHMRHPLRLIRDIGPWGFVGVQVLFLGSLAGAALAPLLWPFWLLLAAAPLPYTPTLHALWVVQLGLGLTLVIQAIGLAIALSRQRRLELARWIPVMMLYYPLATISLCKAVAELVTRPFYWDKTAHGVTRPD
ncbi:Glycosyltransferase, catalytic subunit of cellulose synthase and poly-beta-1,6-N-acetylglucosamine synthase [Palleronia marisminoris]|uniref:Beta-monoglucosyldiacylglycerol synthase n=1 Tax=Palleronia marisminoris TaxID=315423 RepID=A0A1Y5SJ89_9RHOB|nr:glycosyltransferase family 2 protein [Palleronia marisminoris]SFG79661.1 Glycosyltransferase, catalytic subunit of cellulose synthase and poly-beta-1,6-N-acetylglucosamine synthase [Palleronia marisminoris]SLN39120.1 Beta-monoglucosyldiacylglycerol synthase [Palleronia marisminoris]